MWWTIFVVLVIIAAYGTVNVQSGEIRGWIGALIAVIFLLGLQKFLITQANELREKKLTFFDLIVTSEDNRYSLSRLQIYIWTFWVVIAFVQVAFVTVTFPAIPTNVAVLLGINGFTSVLSTAMTDTAKLKINKADNPDFFRDIFLDKEGTLDLSRTQMFVWTLIILVTHMVIFWNWSLSGKHLIPEVDGGLLILMGVSNGAYLGVKVAAEKK